MKILPIPMLEILPVAVMAAVLSGCHSTISVEASSTRNPVVAPAGSVLRVRLNETLESGRSRPGDRFSGVLDSALLCGSSQVLPKGTAVEGRVVAAQDLEKSGHKGIGRSVLSVRLSGFEADGMWYPIEANTVTRTAMEPARRVVMEADSIIGFTLTGILSN
jgi:hypothetical protein